MFYKVGTKKNNTSKNKKNSEVQLYANNIQDFYKKNKHISEKQSEKFCKREQNVIEIYNNETIKNVEKLSENPLELSKDWGTDYLENLSIKDKKYGKANQKKIGKISLKKIWTMDENFCWEVDSEPFNSKNVIKNDKIGNGNINFNFRIGSSDETNTIINE